MKTMDEELGALLRAAVAGDPIGAVDTDRVVVRGRRGVRRRQVLAAGGSMLVVAGVAGSLFAAQGLTAGDPVPTPPAAATDTTTSAVPNPPDPSPPIGPVTPFPNPATADQLSKTLRAVLVDHVDPQRKHLQFRGGEFGLNGLGGFRDLGGRVAWREPGQKGEGFVWIGLAERPGAINGCGSLEPAMTCRDQKLPGGRTIQIGHRGEATDVYYQRPDGKVAYASVRPLFHNNTQIPVHDIAITDAQLIAMVQDSRLQLPAPSKEQREQEAKLIGFKPTLQELGQAAARHLTGGTLTRGYTESVPEEIGANYDWRGNGVRQEVFLAVYAGTMAQSCGNVSRSNCERVVAPNGKIALYKQTVWDPNKRPAGLPSGTVYKPNGKQPVTVIRNAVYLQPDGNWAVASVRMKPGDVDKGITKEQLVALVTDPVLDR